MAEDTKTEWASNSNDAVQISLVQPGNYASRSISSFAPTFTYPIFGEEEQIFGYKDLSIDIAFAAHDLYPNVCISFESKFKEIGDTKATDLLELLKDFLPPYAFESQESFESRFQDSDASSFKPPGQLFSNYSRDGRSYEIWCGELTDPAVKLLLERMQIFVSFFIEAGTPLTLDDQEWTLARWRVFFIYEKLHTPLTPNGSVYSIVGYSTSYRFLTYLPVKSNTAAVTEIPPKEPLPVSSLPCRGRISQFLILPPHQGQSHGSELYSTMVDVFLKDKTCIEITIEDPNESFDDLRDYCDFNRLKAKGTFEQLKINTDIDPKLTRRRNGVLVPTSKLIDKDMFRTLKSREKIAPRQWNRLVEMYLLSQIPKYVRESGTSRLTQKAKASNPDDRGFYYWRLLAKQRIYKQNKDVLAQLEVSERLEKLEETLNSQLDEYLRLLQRLDERRGSRKDDEEEANGEEAAPTASTRERKRKVIEDDDEDEDIGTEVPGTKKRKEDES
ncbi:MAG: histone acetyltransferase 1 [Stictis urceolatum]|nr:histone acetyltransferase 1 [Stictis urceolata]